jgi:hypothetical protein
LRRRVDKEKEEEFLRTARDKVAGIDSAEVEALIKRVKSGRVSQTDREEMKRLLRIVGWFYENVNETSEEEKWWTKLRKMLLRLVLPRSRR